MFPAELIALTLVAAASLSMSAMSTLAPSSARRRDVAPPIPWAPAGDDSYLARQSVHAVPSLSMVSPLYPGPGQSDISWFNCGGFISPTTARASVLTKTRNGPST